MGNAYYRGPVSDHFDGEAFFNPGGIPPRGFGDLLRWQFGGDKATWPEGVGIVPARPDARVADLRVTLVGHASVLIQAGGVNVLTDPVWSRRVSPVSFAGPARVTAPGIAFDDLPDIDVVLLSHNHYDHMDIETLRRLHDRFAMPVVTPLGNDTILRDAIGGHRRARRRLGRRGGGGGRDHPPAAMPPLERAGHAGPQPCPVVFLRAGDRGGPDLRQRRHRLRRRAAL